MPSRNENSYQITHSTTVIFTVLYLIDQFNVVINSGIIINSYILYLYSMYVLSYIHDIIDFKKYAFLDQIFQGIY